MRMTDEEQEQVFLEGNAAAAEAENVTWDGLYEELQTVKAALAQERERGERLADELLRLMEVVSEEDVACIDRALNPLEPRPQSRALATG